MKGERATVMYVCDLGRLHHLLTSIASWQRFATYPIAVVDIGLTERGRRAIAAVAVADVRFLPPCDSPPVPGCVVDRRRAHAYAQKTLIGMIGAGDPIIFLDSDILVVHPDFLPRLVTVPERSLLAAPSVWDADFTWTYTATSLRWLRSVTGQPSLTLATPICNSGVWAMRRRDAGAVAPHWHAAFRAALDAPGLHETLKPGTQIGDQEFLVPACNAAGVTWRRLHGSFNMQVHERLMPWKEGPGGHPLGGGLGEPLEPVLAIHYGCEPDGSVHLTSDMIASQATREWICAQYRAVSIITPGGGNAHMPEAP